MNNNKQHLLIQQSDKKIETFKNLNDIPGLWLI
jgi:hypothetical protein